ncbi:unnamed protein product, partial [Scytosiphon promiscuus]
AWARERGRSKHRSRGSSRSQRTRTVQPSQTLGSRGGKKRSTRPGQRRQRQRQRRNEPDPIVSVLIHESEGDQSMLNRSRSKNAVRNRGVQRCSALRTSGSLVHWRVGWGTHYK